MAAHAIVVPYPGQGHINPLMQLAAKLASNGITVTFVLTESWHKIITEAQDNAFTYAQSLGLSIRAGLIPDCVAEPSRRWANMMEFFLSLDNMEIHVNQLITNLNRSGTRATCIIADISLKWAVPLAKKHSLQSILLWPMSVTNFSIFYHNDTIGAEEWIDYIPGVPPLQRADLPFTVTPAGGHVITEIVVIAGEADLIVANSFYALDCRAVDALRQKMKAPLHCVGPLLPSAYFDRPDCRGRKLGTGSGIETDCSQWLENKPPLSVIYVSFGSFIPVSRSQIWEIAHGLMKSGCYFVWALRPDKEASNVSDMLPPGFQDECKDQGFVAPWFNQVEILHHFSVGGFLSHCGWNAVMESISSGVPMLGFPLGVDQFPNCKLVVDEWKFGLRLRRREDENRVIAGEEISRKVKMLMEGEEGVKVRGVAEKYRELASREVMDGGGSAINVEALVNQLRAA